MNNAIPREDNMGKNEKLYLLSAVAFDIGSLCAFLIHFSGNVSGYVWLILGMAFAVLSYPMYMRFLKERIARKGK